jgi:ubiquinone biosynthesis protein UbiJ
MKDYQKRVVEEKEQVAERLNKLEAFLTSEVTEEPLKVSQEEIDYLTRQVKIMTDYVAVLNERIVNFDSDTGDAVVDG